MFRGLLGIFQLLIIVSQSLETYTGLLPQPESKQDPLTHHTALVGKVLLLH